MFTKQMPSIFGGIVLLGLACTAHAQDLSPEDQAILNQMMRANGMDPEQVRKMQAQQASAQQWTDRVHYQVIGVFRAKTNVSADSNWIAYADATDRVDMGFDWTMQEGKVIGTPTIRNSKTAIANPRNWEPKCAPPSINGPYEHAEVKEVQSALGTSVHLQVQTSYPAVGVHQFCTGALKNIPAAQRSNVYDLPVPSPVLLSMSIPDHGRVKVSGDHKSLVLDQQDGWTWTFTPSARK